MLSSLVRGKKENVVMSRPKITKGTVNEAWVGQRVLRNNIEKTSSNGKNRAVVLWEYSYNERGSFSRYLGS